jgi:putative peptidoglycan lipid II flippase
VKIALGVLAATQLMNLAFVPWIGHAGLALSIGLAALVNAGFLLGGLLRQGVFRPQAGWRSFMLRVLLANAALGAVLGWAGTAVDWVGLQAHEGQRVAAVAAVLGGVALLYFGVLAAAGLRPRDLVRRA